MRGPLDVMRILPLATTASVSLISTMVIPSFVPQAATNVWVKYGVQAGVAIGGGMVVRNIRALGPAHAAVWTVTGFAVIVGDLLKTYLLPQLGLTVGDYVVSDYTTISDQEEIGAFPGEVGAFPFTNQEYAQAY